jgi:hypothetical protein
MASIAYADLVSKFEDGDFPNGGDFKDLIDSTYNYSLSNLPEIGSFLVSYLGAVTGNWQNTYLYVNASSGRLESSYTYANTNSATNASRAFVQSNYLNLTGGTISGPINVGTISVATRSQILSAGVDVLSIIANAEVDSQTLTWDQFNKTLSISRGNQVNLGSLSPTVNVPFTHLSFNPSNNISYTFGQISQVSPAQGRSGSRSFKSLYNGTITEGSISNSFTTGSFQESTFILVNRTTVPPTSATLTTVRYTTDFIPESTSLTQTFRTGARPTGWSDSNVVYVADPGGHASLENLDSDSYLITPSFVGTQYAQLSVQISHRLGNAGESGGRVQIYYSLDNSDPVNFDGDVNGGLTVSNDNQAVWVTDSIIIPQTSALMKIRIGKTGDTAKRQIRNLVVQGLYKVDDTLKNFSFPGLVVNRDDVLDVVWRTPAWNIPPTNVVNYINLKFNTLLS